LKKQFSLIKCTIETAIYSSRYQSCVNFNVINNTQCGIIASKNTRRFIDRWSEE